MNTILPENAVINPRDARNTDAEVNSLKNYMGWLREWEQAQWRTSPWRGGGQAAVKPSEGSADLATRQPVTGAEDGAWSRTASSATKDGLLPSAPMQGPATGAPAALNYSPVSQSAQNQTFPLYSAVAPAFYDRCPIASVSEPLPPSLAFSLDQMVEWQPYLLHILPGAMGVRVWIRDRRLSEISDQDLLVKVRSELRAKGMKLEALTVNGKEIWRATDTDNKNLESSDGAVSLLLDRIF